MGTITAILIGLSLVTGCVTLQVGYQVGHGQTELVSHLNWAMGTLLLQFAATCIAFMHARAEKRYVTALEDALAEAQKTLESTSRQAEPSSATVPGDPPGGNP